MLMLALIILGTGCKSKKVVMKPDVQKDINTANQDGTTLDYDEAVKRHFEMQSNSTKRMMIDSDKKRSSRNYGLKRAWYDQLFNNSCLRNSAMVKTGHSYVSLTKDPSCFIKK